MEECIEWVRTRMVRILISFFLEKKRSLFQEKLSNMEFLEDLETLEEMFEQHKIDNRDIQDFRQNVDECIARQVRLCVV